MQHILMKKETKKTHANSNKNRSNVIVQKILSNVVTAESKCINTYVVSQCTTIASAPNIVLKEAENDSYRQSYFYFVPMSVVAHLLLTVCLYIQEQRSHTYLHTFKCALTPTTTHSVPPQQKPIPIKTEERISMRIRATIHSNRIYGYKCAARTFPQPVSNPHKKIQYTERKETRQQHQSCCKRPSERDSYTESHRLYMATKIPFDLKTLCVRNTYTQRYHQPKR